ncbi:hypothetical protein HY625_00990 [Candidatus Uhrbacteria bacterium]|nr:hypothetical protein [Candidatus Uhrbacteria bacterium]
MQKLTKRFINMGVGIGALLLPIIALAQDTISSDQAKKFGIDVLTASGLGSRGLRETVGSIINVFMGLLGTVAIVIILIGGFQWMTAGGNEEKVEKAKQMLGAGVIGLAIILAAYSITRFVIGSLITATT